MSHGRSRKALTNTVTVLIQSKASPQFRCAAPCLELAIHFPIRFIASACAVAASPP